MDRGAWQGFILWGHKEPDTTEWRSIAQGKATRERSRNKGKQSQKTKRNFGWHHFNPRAGPPLEISLQHLTTSLYPSDVLFWLLGSLKLWFLLLKGGSQEISGVTGKFGLRVQNKAGKRLTEFCQDNALVIANTLFQQHKRRLYT